MNSVWNVKPQVGFVSLVGILSTDYPLSFGNYFGIMIANNSIPVINMNYENFKEAMKRFNIEELKFADFRFGDKRCIAIIDERIPQDWYHMWTAGYANGKLNKLEFECINCEIGERFGGKTLTISSNLLNDCLRDLASVSFDEAVKFYQNLMGGIDHQDAVQYITKLIE